MYHRDRQYIGPDSTTCRTPFQNLHMFKNTQLRLHCDIPNSHLEDQSPAEPSSAQLINVEMRSTTPLFVDSNLDHIVSLERTLCSNYFCCGCQLPDLHALLEHFEEDHVVVLSPNGRRVYPCEGLRTVPLHPVGSTSTTPTSSRSSSVTPPSPSSSGPSSPSDCSSPNSGSFTSSQKSSLTVTPVYTPFTPSLPVDPADPYPDAEEIVMPHEPAYEFPPDLFPSFPSSSKAQVFTSAPSSSDEDEEMSDSSSSPIDHPISPIPTYVYGTDKIQPIAAIPRHLKFASTIQSKGRPSLLLEGVKNAVRAQNTTTVLPMASASSSKSKARNRYATSGNASSKRREKSYHCPTPRCTKVYLNPNGLKYHMEKGTCKLEGDSEGDLLREQSVSASPAPSSSNSYTAIQPRPGPDRPKVSSNFSLIQEDEEDVQMHAPADDLVAHSSGTSMPGSNTHPTPNPNRPNMSSNHTPDFDSTAPTNLYSVDGQTRPPVEVPVAGTYHHQGHQESIPSVSPRLSATRNPSVTALPAHLHTQLHQVSPVSPNVNFNGSGVNAAEWPLRQEEEHAPNPNSHLQLSAISVCHDTESTPVQTQPQLHPQHQQQPVYHCPVPSYPQVGGPNALLGVHPYGTYIRRPTSERPPMSRAVPAGYGTSDGVLMQMQAHPSFMPAASSRLQ